MGSPLLGFKPQALTGSPVLHRTAAHKVCLDCEYQLRSPSVCLCAHHCMLKGVGVELVNATARLLPTCSKHLRACGATCSPARRNGTLPLNAPNNAATSIVHLLAAGLPLEGWSERERALQGQVEQLGQRLARAEAAASQVQVSRSTAQADLPDVPGAAACHDPVGG